MKSTKIFKCTRLSLAALLPLSLLCAAGCGGGSSSSGTTPLTQYAEVVTLPTGQTGALILAVNSNHSTTGTLAVAGTGTATASLQAHGTAKSSPLTPMAAGVYPVAGTLTSDTFTLTSAAFTLTGSLPGGAVAPSFTLTVGTGTNALVYTGTLATASGSDSALAGTYQLTSITNPATSQTAMCPGTLAFGSSDNDTCTASEIYTLSSNGTYTLTGVGAVNTGIYTLVGNIVTRTGPTISNGQNGPAATDVVSVVISGNTFTSTLLGTTDVTSQAQIGEVSTFTKTGTAAAFLYAGTYTSSSQVSGLSGSSTSTGTVSISPAGVLTVVTSSSGYYYTGTASLNSSGQIVVSATNSSNSDIETYIGTASGSPGSYTISGTLSNSNGGTGTFTLTESGTTAASLILAGTTWRVSSYSGAVVVPTCPGTATTSEGIVVDCGSDDHVTFNADGSDISVGLGGDGSTHTTAGTWIQNGNIVTQTNQSETPPDPTNIETFPVTYAEAVTVIDASHFTIPLPFPGQTTPITADFTKE